MFLQVAVAIVVVLCARAVWWRWRYDLHRIPSPGLPLLGNTLDFVGGDAANHFAKWGLEKLRSLGYPKLMIVWVLNKPFLIATDDEFLASVMFANDDAFPRDVDGGGMSLPLLGNDVTAKSINATAETTAYVKAVRSVYFSAFNADGLKRAASKMNAILRRLCAKIDAVREKGPVDFQDLFVRMTLDFIGQVMFEANLGGLDGSRSLYEVFKEAAPVARKKVLDPVATMYARLCPWSKTAKSFRNKFGALTVEWQKLTDEICKRPAPPESETPMWDRLRNLVDPETEKQIPRNALVAEVATAVIAGMDTTGHQLGFIFGLLGSHPNVVDRLLEELKVAGLMGEEAREVEVSDMVELTYLTAVVKEGMRLTHVIAATLGRKVPKDMTIHGYRIPKGVVITRMGSQGSLVESVWKDPWAFKPERWLTGEDLSSRWNVMFSIGPRQCPGQRLAMLEMRLVIANLLPRYALRLQGNYKKILLENTYEGFSLEAKDGVPIHVTPREKEYCQN